MDFNGSIAAASAFASAIAAIAALLQVRKASLSNEASAYLQLISYYASPEMRTSISELSSHWRAACQFDKSVVEHYLEIKKQDQNKARIIRGHCRLVSAYFIDSLRLYQAGLLSKKILKLAVAHPGLNVFYEVQHH